MTDETDQYTDSTKVIKYLHSIVEGASYFINEKCRIINQEDMITDYELKA